MSSSALASYLPDSQLITIKPDIPAYTDINKPRGFVGANEIAYFLHEWFHYLHNVSTAHGLSSFTNHIALWNEFRRSIGSNGLSDGSQKLDENTQLRISQKIKFLEATRKPGGNLLPPKTAPHHVEVRSYSLKSEPLPGLTDISSCSVQMELVVSNSEGDKYQCEATLGSHEIIESVAFLLESRLIKALGETPKDEATVVPYHLLSLLGSFIAPSLDEESILICGLAALQSSFPACDITELLESARQIHEGGKSVRESLASDLARALSNETDWVNDLLQEIDKTYPLDEPMARSVLETTKTIRRNFSHRIHDPFFELSVIERIAEQKESLKDIMNDTMEKYGVCAFLQEREGLGTVLQCDYLLDVVMEPDNNELREGRRIMQASFHFMRQHFTSSGFVPTNQLGSTHKNKCPFFTSCGLDRRKDQANVCASTPWVGTSPPEPELCWYQQGVLKVSPPPTAQ